MSSILPFVRCSILGLLTGLFCPSAFAEYTLNLTKGVTPISRDIHQLHMTILWVCVAIGILVYGLMVYAIIRHRKSKHNTPADFHESTTIEIIWTIIPFIILIVMAIPATKTLINMHDANDAELTIKITGHRWYWQYEYLDRQRIPH